MFYMISPPEPTDWHLDQARFTQELVSDWPGVSLQPPEPKSATRAMVWMIEDAEGGSQWLEGSLDREGQTIYLRGDVTLAAEFAGWLRRNVDPDQPLIFTDEAFDHLVDLVDDTSAQRIVDAYVVT